MLASIVKSKWKFFGHIIIKAALIISIFIFIINQLYSLLIDQTKALNWYYIILFVVLNQAANIMVTFRFKYILEIFNIYINISNLAYIHFKSMFYFFIVPLNIGTEMVRFSQITKLLNFDLKRKNVLNSQLIDRFYGLITALISFFICMPNSISIPPNYLYLSFILLICIILLVIYLIYYLNKLYIFKKIIFFFSDKVSRYKIYRSFFLSFIANSATSFSLYFALKGLGINSSLIIVAFCYNASIIFSLIPISIFGVGFMELGSATIFSMFGENIESGQKFAAIVFCSKLLIAIQGGFLEILNLMKEFFTKKRINLS